MAMKCECSCNGILHNKGKSSKYTYLTKDMGGDIEDYISNHQIINCNGNCKSIFHIEGNIFGKRFLDGLCDRNGKSWYAEVRCPVCGYTEEVIQ